MAQKELTKQKLEYWREPNESEKEAIYNWFRSNYAIDEVDREMDRETFNQCIVFEAHKCPDVAYNERVFVLLGQLELRGARAFRMMDDDKGNTVVVEVFI